MCEKIREHVVNGKSEFVVPSESGSDISDGRIGEPIPSESDAPPTAAVLTDIDVAGAQLVRHHKGLTDILVGSLMIAQEAPATFSALKLAALGGYTVTLSCVLTSSQYGALIATLEMGTIGLGESGSVGVDFEPTTPNLVPQDTAQSI